MTLKRTYLCTFDQAFVVLDSKLAVICMFYMFHVAYIAKIIILLLNVLLLALQLLDLLVISAGTPKASCKLNSM